MTRTRPAFSRLPALALAAVLLAAPAAFAAPDGVVYVQNGEQHDLRDVELVSVGLDAVRFKNGGKETTVPSSDVHLVVFADATSDYRAGWRALDRRDGKGALDAFKKVLSAKAADVISGDWPAEYANAGIGEAHVLLGNWDDALAAFEKARKANTKGLLAGRILTGTVEAYLGKNDTAKAIAAADALASAGRSARRSDLELDAEFLKARVHMGSGNHAAASSAFDAAARLAGDLARGAKDASHRRALESRLRTASAEKGWVLVEKARASGSQADFDSAAGYFKKLASDLGESVEIAAAAENAQGVVKFERGDYAGALRHFQTVEVKHFVAGSEVARSLYYQSLCWDKLGDTEQKGARQRDLREYFPKSEWTRKLP